MAIQPIGINHKAANLAILSLISIKYICTPHTQLSKHHGHGECQNGLMRLWSIQDTHKESNCIVTCYHKSFSTV